MPLIEIVLAALAILLVARLIEPYVARAIDAAYQARLKSASQQAEMQGRTLRNRLPQGKPGMGPIEAYLKRRPDNPGMDSELRGEDGER